MKDMIVVVTGMHRSGTSLFTNILEEAGFNLGHNLIAPNKGNPNGYYEDLDVVNFHNSILKRSGYNYLFSEKELNYNIKADDILLANEIINKFKELPYSAIKDPRISLFLNFWDSEITANKRYVLLYRHPFKVVDSLIRRNTDKKIYFDYKISFNSWYMYNKKIKEFLMAKPNDCYLLEIDKFISKPEKYIEQLSYFLQKKIEIECFQKIYKYTEFKKQNVNIVTKIISLLDYKNSVNCINLYNDLNKLENEYSNHK